MNLSKFKCIILAYKTQLKLFAKECLLPAVILHLVVEMFARESLVNPFVYLFTSPIVFLYNTLLICTTLSLSFLFRRRLFARFLICALWLAIGVTDFILLQFRVTPFTGVDLLLLDSAFSIMNHYLSPFQIILIAAALVLVCAIGVVLYLRTKKETEGASKPGACLLFASFLLVSLIFTKLFVFCGILERNFGNISQGFAKNGLPYCFSVSIFGTGISKPSSYSEEKIDEILAAITNTPVSPVPTAAPLPEETLSPAPTEKPKDITPTVSATPAVDEKPPVFVETEHPNIIFLQLESFFNPEHIREAVFSSAPTPFFAHLRETCPSGFLTVPSIGAGTANTEFEILSGMNLDFFGPGEYPYKTILRETACESLAFNLSAIGLTPHAIHNNDGTFYDRHKVFAQLGFQTFTPIEYMGSYETNPLGWPKDKILTKEILKSLRSTDGQDFIYAISVQGHGAYPEVFPEEAREISVLSLPEELKDSFVGFSYYVNQLYEMDLFLQELCNALSAYEEEVVLVLFGDHLPAFPFTEEMMDNGSLFETEYVIWNNHRAAEPIKCDLESYALSAHVLNGYNIHEGLFTRFHQTQSDSPTYLDDMELLEYDVLYGTNDSYDGHNPYHATDLRFGSEKIEITSLFFQSSSPTAYRLFVNGTNFTSYSIVYINGEPCITTYINPQLVCVSGIMAKENDLLTVTVAQVGNDSNPLSFTNEESSLVPRNTYIED